MSQVDVRYRNIDTASFGTISTKFSYLHVAKVTTLEEKKFIKI